MVSVYKCTLKSCGVEFKGNHLNYCPFCGNELEHIGIVIGGKGLQDDLNKGWMLIMFRKLDEEG